PDAPKRPGEASKRFTHYAIGQESGESRWVLFRETAGEWREIKKIHIPKGNKTRLLVVLAERHGFLPKTEALRVIISGRRRDPADVPKLCKNLNTQLTQLR